MKKNNLTKKIYGFLMSFFMLFTSCPVNLVLAANIDVGQDSFNMTVEANKTDVKAGDVVSVSVNVAENSNIVDAQFVVNYDVSKVEPIIEVDEDDNYVMFNDTLISKKGWAITEPNVNTEDGKIKIVGSSMKGAKGKLTAAGSLVNLQFKVKEGVAGNIDFSVTAEKFDMPGENDEGTIELVPTVENKTEVKVPVALTSISLDKTSLTVNIGESSEALSVVYNPTNTTVDKTVTWSIKDTSIATVKDGVVTGKKVGNTTLTAKVAGKTTSIPVSVKAVLKSISIEEKNITVEKGTTTALTLVLNPTEADKPEIVWTSSDESVATVDSNGKVTAIAKGDTVITATAKNNPAFTATSNVNVGVKLKSISLDQESVTLQRDVDGKDSVTLVAKKLPEDTTDKNDFTWTSSNEKIATVDSTGKVVAVGKGTAQITVKIGTITKVCNVVVEVPLKNISIKEQDEEVLLRQSKTLTLVLDPIDTSVDSKNVVWTSSDDTVATVDKNGKVTALKEGTATITAKLDGKTATTTVIAKRMALNSIAMKNVDTTMLKGKTQTLGLIQNPENTTDLWKATWTSSDESVATVDSNGKVTALKAGTVVITATCDIEGVEPATTEITVEEINLEYISINKTNIDESKFEVGKTFKLNLDVTPENLTDEYELTWASSDENVATIDKSGNVVALKEGKVKFTAHVVTEYGKEFEDTYEVYIQPEVIEEPVASPDTGDINVNVLVFTMVMAAIAMVVVTKKRKALTK